MKNLTFRELTGEGCPEIKNSVKCHTKWWSYCTAKDSALQLHQKGLKIVGTEMRREERNTTSQIYCGDFLSAIKISIIDISTQRFLQYIRECLLKRQKYSKEIWMDRNNEKRSRKWPILMRDVQLSCGSLLFFAKDGSEIAAAIPQYRKKILQFRKKNIQ